LFPEYQKIILYAQTRWRRKRVKYIVNMFVLARNVIRTSFWQKLMQNCSHATTLPSAIDTKIRESLTDYWTHMRLLQCFR